MMYVPVLTDAMLMVGSVNHMLVHKLGSSSLVIGLNLG